MLAMRRTPEMNSFWDDAAQEIVFKHYVNLGIAAATPRGLVVPNVKDAERLTLVDLAAALNELTATRASGKTQPAEMSGGTFTITNVGVFGVDAGTPIINPGESAILCFGAVRKQPWVVSTDDGDEIVVRQVTQLALASTTGTSTARRARASSPTSPRSWRTRPPLWSSEVEHPGIRVRDPIQGWVGAMPDDGCR